VRARRPLFFDAYAKNHRTGAFILVDPLSNATVAAGMILGPAGAARATSTGAASQLDPRARQAALGQRGAVVLLSGMPGAGKTELAYAVERLLHTRGRFALVIDPADEISAKNPATARHPEEVPAAALELCERGAAVGWITVLAFASPRAQSRELVRERAGATCYLEVHVVRSAGVSAGGLHHDPPIRPNLVVDLAELGAEEAAGRVVQLLEARDVFHGE
jgi:bifunctional enzyme CysN/CysC